MNTSNGWKFNPETKHLSHQNGICLKIEGCYGVVHNISPIVIPETVDPIALAKHIREAAEHYAMLTKDLQKTEKKSRPVLRLPRSHAI